MNTAPRGGLLGTSSVHGGASPDRPEGHAHATKRRGHHLKRRSGARINRSSWDVRNENLQDHCREVFAEIPFVAPVANDSLHATVPIKSFWQNFLVKLVGTASGTFGTFRWAPRGRWQTPVSSSRNSHFMVRTGRPPPATTP